jgi:sporulation protein YhbH
VSFPLRSLEEYRFHYAYGKQHMQQSAGTGKTGQPGQERGDDVVDTEVSIADVDEALFAELALPRLEPKSTSTILRPDFQFDTVRKTGTRANIDVKRTIRAALQRGGVPLNGRPRVKRDDLRFRTWQEQPQPEPRAIVLAMMDTSGSMGQFEKYCARSFFFWMSRFLRHHYRHVELVFIAHHTEAKIVEESDFFSRGESGGTVCSSAYALANAWLSEQRAAEQANVYAVHFSDGDNLLGDHERARTEMQCLAEQCQLVGYVEVNPYNRTSTLMQTIKSVEHDGITIARIKDRSQIYGALCTLFGKQQTEQGS